jgi:hypothetical protein
MLSYFNNVYLVFNIVVNNINYSIKYDIYKLNPILNTYNITVNEKHSVAIKNPFN